MRETWARLGCPSPLPDLLPTAYLALRVALVAAPLMVLGGCAWTLLTS